MRAGPTLRRAALSLLLVVTAQAHAAEQTVTVYATADNLLIYDTTNAALAETVFSNTNLAIGCFWIDGFVQNDWTCYTTALRFELPEAVVGRPILGAALWLWGYAGAEDLFTLYGIGASATAWSPSTITFANQPQERSTGQVLIYPPVLNPVVVDVTGIVANWASGAWPNYGFLLEDTSLWFPNYTANRVTALYSMEFYDTPSHRPQLVIDYDGEPLPEITFSADPITIAPGTPSTLHWSATNADSCSLPPEFHQFPPSGTWGVSPSATQTYTITCFGPGGSSSQSVTVTVTPIPVLNFWSDRYVIAPGESAHLVWQSTNALGCEFYRLGAMFAQTVPENGNMTVSPSVTSTYQVTCENFYGEAVRRVTIAVPEAGHAAGASGALLCLLGLRTFGRRRVRPTRGGWKWNSRSSWRPDVRTSRGHAKRVATLPHVRLAGHLRGGLPRAARACATAVLRMGRQRRAVERLALLGMGPRCALDADPGHRRPCERAGQRELRLRARRILRDLHRRRRRQPRLRRLPGEEGRGPHLLRAHRPLGPDRRPVHRRPGADGAVPQFVGLHLHVADGQDRWHPAGLDPTPRMVLP